MQSLKRKLAALDLNFITLDAPTSRQTIGFLAELAGPANMQQAESDIKQALEAFPKLRQRLQGNYWTTDLNFSVTNHLKQHLLPPELNEEELRAALSRIFCKDFNFEHPLWDYRFVSSENRHWLIFRLNHALADGLGGTEFFNFVCGAESRAILTGQSNKASIRASQLSETSFSKSLQYLVSEAVSSAATGPFIGGNSPLRDLYWHSISERDLRPLRVKYRASLNDTLLGLLSRTAYLYFQQQNLKPQTLHALVPFNLRTQAQLRNLGNYISGARIELPSDLPELSQQIYEVAKRIMELRQSGAFGAYRLLALLNSVAPEGIRRQILLRASQKIHFICTNLTVSKEPLKFGGAEIINVHGFPALLPSQGLGFAFVSYRGKLSIGLSSDPQVFPSAAEFFELFTRTMALSLTLG